MAYNRHDDVGGHVVGAVVIKLFTANVARVVDLQELAEQRALPAIGAPARRPTQQGGRHRRLESAHPITVVKASAPLEAMGDCMARQGAILQPCIDLGATISRRGAAPL